MRRIDPRREDGVAMTEFALIVPIFLVIVAGLLGFGRVFFYWIETNHMASETARWAVVDRNPVHRADAPGARRPELNGRVRLRRPGLHRLPGQDADDRRPRRPGPREDPEAVLVRADYGNRHDHDSGQLDDAHRADGKQRRSHGLHRRELRREGLHMRRARDERGAVLAMAAVMIPVFLLLTALVVDVGNWFTHDRQLQNRADAAAHAAGIGYAQNWKACVQNGDQALKLHDLDSAGDRRRRAAVRCRPRGGRLRGGVSPSTLHNRRSRTRRTSTSSSTPTTPTTTTTRITPTPGRQPGAARVSVHAADDLSAAGHWTDVKVKERNLPSLFRTLGLPLNRAGGRARVEIRPAVSGHRFLPLAIPDNEITRVQVRYYNECTDTLIPNSTTTSSSSPSDYQKAWRSTGGGGLWGLQKAATTPGVGDPSRSFHLALPSYTTSCPTTGGEYTPGRRRGATREPTRE